MQGLEHYLSVRDGRIPPRFQQSKSLAVPCDDVSWTRHDQTLASSNTDPASNAGWTLLDLKIALAEREMDSCDLCPHHCFVNRNRGEAGYCGVADKSAVHWEGVLHGEEIEVVPSHEVFLSGCTMRCAFCYSHEHITRPMSGSLISPESLAVLTTKRRAEGAVNLNLVGGEPTVHLLNILRTLKPLDAPIPVVWNSNMYATPKTMNLLNGVVDLFLGDIHFGNDACAKRLGRIPNYLESLTASFASAVSSGASVIIRHLVMPGHLACCARPAIDWAKANFPETPFHLMFQYVPDYRAVNDPILGRPLSDAEAADIYEHAQKTGVRLYNERRTDLVGQRVQGSQTAASEPIGETVDILVRADGKVTFTRLLESLLPVAQSLDHHDARLEARAAVIEKVR